MIPAGLGVALVLGMVSGIVAALVLSTMSTDDGLVLKGSEFRRGESIQIGFDVPADSIAITGLFGEPITKLAVFGNMTTWDQKNMHGQQVFDGAYKIVAYSGDRIVGSAIVHVFEGGLAEWWSDVTG